MSAETDFRALLTGHAPLVAVVPVARIAQNGVDAAAVAFPCIVFTSTHAPEYGLDNTLMTDQVTFAVQCWGETSAQAATVAGLVRDAVAIDGDYLVLTEETTFDSETELDGVSLTIDRWLP
jgi:uroporphyrinogen-III synthase